jgi:hypothetical protein
MDRIAAVLRLERFRDYALRRFDDWRELSNSSLSFDV